MKRVRSRDTSARCLHALLAACSLGAALTGQATQLKNIHPSGNSNPQEFVQVGDKIYFSATEPLRGRELYVYDGNGPARLVKDIRPGRIGGNPINLVGHGNHVYFQANDGVSGPELWRSDGTSAGTNVVKDIHPGSRGSAPGQMVSFKGLLFFAATDGSKGRELWQSSGSSAGTKLVRDIHIGSTGSSPNEMTIVNGVLYFTAAGTDSRGNNLGREIWRSDATVTGTRIVRDMVQGSGSNDPRFLKRIGNELWFRPKKSTTGTAREMWKTNGQRFGARRVTDHTVFSDPVLFQSRVYFQAQHPSLGRELYRTDGSPAGTELFADIEPGLASSGALPVAVLDDQLVFTARTSQHGQELWATNGTVGNARLIKDILPGARSGVVGEVTPVGTSHILFVGHDEKGRELHVTNGTTRGTWRVQHINQGPGDANIDGISVGRDWVAFRANNGSHGNEPFAMRKSSITEASFTVIGPGCPGTGRQSFAIQQNNPNGGAFASTTGRTSRVYAISTGTMSTTLQIYGYELYTHSLTSGARVMPASLHVARADGSPDENPIATGLMRVRPEPGFYRIVFRQPVLVRAGTGLYISVDGDVTRLPKLTAGPVRTTYSRAKTSTVFRKERFGSRWSYKVLTRGFLRASPRIGNYGLPKVGRNYEVSLTDGLGGAIAVLAMGFSEDEFGSLALPFDLTGIGAPGCHLRIAQDVFLGAGVLDSLGATAFPMFLPNDASLKGVRLFHQWFVVDAQANALGIAASSTSRSAIGL